VKAKPTSSVMEPPKGVPSLIPNEDARALVDSLLENRSEESYGFGALASAMSRVQPAVQIAIPSNMEHLPALFVDNLSALHKPALWTQDIIREATIAAMRNEAVEMMLGAKVRSSQGAKQMTHLFMLDNDMVYPPSTLMELLRSDVDVVAGWGCSRVAPYYHNFMVPSDTGEFYDVPTTLPTPAGLHEVGAVGACGMLIRREVLEALEPPWFADVTDEETGTRIGEDVYFCRKARAAGFKVWCRTDLRFGHMVPSLVFPSHGADGEYTAEARFGV